MMYSDEDGELAVKYARAVIERVVGGANVADFEFPEHFNENTGAFVTLNTYPENELRGCIGYAGPFFPLVETLTKAAVGATQDPRFPNLSSEELEQITVEVSLLTTPQPIEVKDPNLYPGEIEIGRDGLIIEKSANKGLLLPQVPVEWEWDSETYLRQLCTKAGLMPDAWREHSVKISRFTGQVFYEESPGGPVKRKELHERS